MVPRLNFNIAILKILVLLMIAFVISNNQQLAKMASSVFDGIFKITGEFQQKTGC
jgi:hypothetical protein